MENRDAIDALLTQIGIIMEDGTECLLSRRLDTDALTKLITETCNRIDTLQMLVVELRGKHDRLSARKN